MFYIDRKEAKRVDRMLRKKERHWIYGIIITATIFTCMWFALDAHSARSYEGLDCVSVVEKINP